MIVEELQDILQNWDGKHMGFLQQLYHSYVNEPDFFSALVEITISSKDLQAASTWLIKHHYDEGKQLKKADLATLYQGFPNLAGWEARLHILQILNRIKIEYSQLEAVDEFVRTNLNSENKFVKAWAYQGLFELCSYIPEYKNEVKLLCDNAMLTESAAVKSRVKKIIKALEND